MIYAKHPGSAGERNNYQGINGQLPKGGRKSHMSAHVQLVELGRTSIPLPNIGSQRADESPNARIVPRTEITVSAIEARLAAIPFEEMDVVYDGNEGVLFAYFSFAGRPSFTPAILRDI